MTSGQNLALWQLQEIAAVDGYSLEVESVKKPSDASPLLLIAVSIHIGPIPKAEGGLQLHERETFLFTIPPTFPFQKSEVWVEHDRFAGKPHVQWVHYLCLYQSAGEWNVSDGMFGLIDRLVYWLRQGALNQLDPEGQPLHPPAVYADYEKGKLVIPKANTPTFQGAYWAGVAGILNLPTRIEITKWFDLNNIPNEGDCALALLFAAPLPWEYPTKGVNLFRECERQGVPKEFLFRILKASSILTPKGQPIYCVMGSPMRGIAGGPRKQHLSVWMIEAQTADYIRNTISETSDTAEITELRVKFEELLVHFLENAKISWCPVVEARPEITIRRDQESIISYFRGKSVSIWGCGALGAHIAICLCRAGVRRLVLRDKGMVIPGILVRQPYIDDDVGKLKVEALKNQLLAIRPELEILPYISNLETELSTGSFEWSDGSDLVIDATASELVRRRLEMIWNSSQTRRVLIAALMLDQSAKRLITGVVGTEFSGGTWDVFRQAKLKMLSDQNFVMFADSFFLSDVKQRPFQPEPGCSEPTFIGSAADSAGLAAIGLNLIAKEFVQNPSLLFAVSHAFTQPTEFKPGLSEKSGRFDFQPDFVLRLNDNEVRINQAALREIKAWITQNKRIRNRKVETGGLLWGEWDDATSIVWVTDASGPPPDSHHSEESFICGSKGTREEHETRIKLTRFSVGYIGMWHTHPVSQAFPSGRDFIGMHQILTSGPLPPRKNILLIIGKENGVDTIGVYLFRRMTGDTAAALHEFHEARVPLLEAML